MSLPVRERGLKLQNYIREIQVDGVAPRAGAWIEITRLSKNNNVANVAPRAGAWIEMNAVRSRKSM